MICRVSLSRLRLRASGAPLGVLGVLLLGLLGCVTEQPRGQSEDDNDHDRYGIKTVGDVTTVGNAGATPLGGVGIVTGLEGTGGEAPNDSYRTLLEDQMRKKGVKNVKEIMTSPNCALVLVSAQLPAGARKGDTFDVEVALPPRSKATSLRGGYLKECVLFNYDYTSHLSTRNLGSPSTLQGHTLAHAQGPVLVGFGDGEDSTRQKRGRIWGGAHSLIDHNFTLVLNSDQQFARVASLVADRVNDAFTMTGSRMPGNSVATASDKLAVALRVPPQYRFNLPRYLRVVRLVPQHEPHGEGGSKSYRQRLAEDLLDPGHTVTAALRLEALGQGSIPVLKTGLSHAHPLVRFCCAEALAYLGSPACGEELARAVFTQPTLRAFGLTALASLDEAVCQVKLQELLAESTDDETRYGAFRALRTMDERNQAIRGEHLNESFWLHRVAPNTPGMIHVSTTRRAEIVLFGEEAALKPPFSFLAGDFAITATAEDERCTISRFTAGSGNPIRRQMPMQVRDVIKCMADLGAEYPEVVELLQQAHHCECLTCRVRFDALPQNTPVDDLVKAGKGKPGTEDILVSDADLGATPTLFDTGRGSRSQRLRQEEKDLTQNRG